MRGARMSNRVVRGGVNSKLMRKTTQLLDVCTVFI
jgi:hypothetical protein